MKDLLCWEKARRKKCQDRTGEKGKQWREKKEDFISYEILCQVFKKQQGESDNTQSICTISITTKLKEILRGWKKGGVE